MVSEIITAAICLALGFWVRGVLRMQKEKWKAYAADAELSHLDREKPTYENFV